MKQFLVSLKYREIITVKTIILYRNFVFFIKCLKSKKKKLAVTSFYHGTIIRTGITCKKIPCYMRDSACRWFIVKVAKLF